MRVIHADGTEDVLPPYNGPQLRRVYRRQPPIAPPSTYARRHASGRAARAGSRQADALTAAVIAACVTDPGRIPVNQIDAVRRTVAELRARGASHAAVAERAARYYAAHPGARLSPSKLARLWDRLA